MSDFFDSSGGDIPVNGASIKIRSLDYSSFKTPQFDAPTRFNEQRTGLNIPMLQSALSAQKLGFTFWDSESKQRISATSFTFYVLDIVSFVSGKEGKSKDDPSYWSNRVLDTRKDAFFVCEYGSKNPRWSGLYADFKASLPSKQVACRTAFAAWSPELGFIEVPASAYAGWGAQNSMAHSNKNGVLDPSRVKLYDIAKKDGEIWAFRFDGANIPQSFVAVGEMKDGGCKPYDGKGELFFTPFYQCGVIKAESEKYKHVFDRQKEYREFLMDRIKYNNDKWYLNKPGEQQAAPAQAQPPIKDMFAPNYGNTPAIQKNQTSTNLPANQVQAPLETAKTPPPVETAPPDDLPF